MRTNGVIMVAFQGTAEEQTKPAKVAGPSYVRRGLEANVVVGHFLYL